MRPLPRFYGHIGQREIVARIEPLLTLAARTGKALPTLLIAGQRGLGQRSFVREIATCADRPLVELLVFDSNLIHTLSKGPAEGVYAMAEAHRLPSHHSTLLLRFFGSASGARSLILVSPHPEAVDEGLRAASELLVFRRYSDREIGEILAGMATARSVVLTGQARTRLAAVCRGRPCLAERRLDAVIARLPTSRELGIREVVGALADAGIDELGLDPLQRDYLAAVAHGRATPQALARRLGLPAALIAADVEPELEHLGLIARRDDERTLTSAGVAATKTALRVPKGT